MSQSQPTRLSDPFANKNEAIALGLELEKTLNGLSEVLAAETAHARAGRLRDAAALQPDKMRFTDSFLKIAERLRSNAGYFRNELPEMAQKVQKLHARFCDEVSRNLAALGTAKALSESLVQEIVDTAKDIERSAGYTAQGHAPKQSYETAPPLRVNVSL